MFDYCKFSSSFFPFSINLFILLQSVQHFVEYNYQQLKMLRDTKVTKKECKAEIGKLGKEVTDLKGGL